MFDLPAAGPYRLGRAPLVQALAQVRFPIQSRLASLEGLSAIQDGLRDRYPFLETEALPTFQLQIGQGAPQAAIGQGAGRFVFSGEDGFSVTIGPDLANLTAGASYAGADDFKARFEEILAILHQSVPMVRCDRLAARFLNVAASPPGDASAWATWFRPEVTGWPGAGVVGEGSRVQSALNQVQLAARPQDPFAGFPGEVTALVRTGLVPGGSVIEGMPPVQVDTPSFVIDLDIFTAQAQPWRQEALTEQFGVLHDQIDRFFRWTLTEAGAAAFEIEEIC